MIKSYKGLLKWFGWGLLFLLLLIFVIRVVVFENNYYSEKEGSERAVTDIRLEEGNTAQLVEEEPTEEEVREYYVDPDKPRYLTIESLGIYNSRVLQMGVNYLGEVDTPYNIFDVGWYEGSSTPGAGGTMLIDGHNGGPHVYGVFKNLPDLAKGDIIKIERGDGVVFNYSVYENTTVDLAEADAYMKTALKSPVEGKESLTLISCTGEWSQQQLTFLSRQFVRAILVQN